MKKKRIAILLVVAAIVVLTGAALFWNHLYDYSTTLNANWGIRLPSRAHYSEIYCKEAEANFHGDGVRYHVFSYEEEEPIREMLDWGDQEDVARSYQNVIAAWLEEIQVPEGELPDYTNCYYWYACQHDSSKIIIIWNAAQRKLYIAESFL